MPLVEGQKPTINVKIPAQFWLFLIRAFGRVVEAIVYTEFFYLNPAASD